MVAMTVSMIIITGMLQDTADYSGGGGDGDGEAE